jgi:hypothetical protein
MQQQQQQEQQQQQQQPFSFWPLLACVASATTAAGISSDRERD